MYEPQLVAQALKKWFVAVQRDLPWRRTRDPYAIWVSEVMLQQTRIDTVLAYYQRFMDRFPTLEMLATSSLDDVLTLWQGLGYYSRARNLQAAARYLYTQLDGRWPRTRKEWLALPGVGEYTAGAVLSIAFDQPEPAIDGNVRRVVARLLDYDQDVMRAEGRRLIHDYVASLLGHESPRVLSQALMELGATICVPSEPRCDRCPLKERCLARTRGTQGERPVKRLKRPLAERLYLAAYVEGQEGILVLRRIPRGFLGGLWELPIMQAEGAKEQPRQLIGRLAQILDVACELDGQVSAVSHTYTHFRQHITVFRCRIEGKLRPGTPWDQYHWLRPDQVSAFALTGATVKILRSVGWLPLLGV